METTSSEAPAAAPAAPTLFLRNATGLVKGWSGFDAFGYSFMAVNLVTLGMFYSLAVFAYVPTASPVLSILIASIAVTFLAIAYAALVAVMPRAGGDYVWQTRVLDGLPGIVTGVVVGGVGFFLVSNALALGDTLALIAAVVGVVVGGVIGRLRGGIGFVLAATGWWFILAMWAPIYGAILKLELFQPLAALRWVRRWCVVLRVGQRDARRFDHRDRPDGRTRGPRDGGLCAGPALVPLPGARRLRHHGRPDAVLLAGSVPNRLRYGQPADVRRGRRICEDDCPMRQRMTGSSRRSRRSIWAPTSAPRFRPRSRCCRSCCSGSSTRTGARRSTERSAAPATSARSCAGCSEESGSRPGSPSCSSCLRPRRSAGTSTTRPTSISSTGSTGTPRPIRRCRSGATRHCLRRT